jgi:hypothetical protein
MKKNNIVWTLKWLAYKIHMQQKTKYCQHKQMPNKQTNKHKQRKKYKHLTLKLEET